MTTENIETTLISADERAAQELFKYGHSAGAYGVVKTTLDYIEAGNTIEQIKDVLTECLGIYENLVKSYVPSTAVETIDEIQTHNLQDE